VSSSHRCQRAGFTSQYLQQGKKMRRTNSASHEPRSHVAERYLLPVDVFLIYAPEHE
jgi:hypothetical protein